MQDERKGQVNVGFGIAARILEFVPLDWCLGYVPFLVFPKPLETHELRDGLQVDLAIIMGPGSKFEGASLFVEGEVVDVDGAGTPVDGGREPVHSAVGIDLSHGQHGNGVGTSNTENRMLYDRSTVNVSHNNVMEIH